MYLAGTTGLYRSDDWGGSWSGVGAQLRAERVDAVAARPGFVDEVYAVAGGSLWASSDGARSWQPRGGGSAGSGFEVVSLDPSNAAHLWGVAAGQVFRTYDLGQSWHPIGKPLTDGPPIARGVAVWGDVIVIATDRGLFRSADAGERWALASEGLPAHLSARVLVRDPRSPATLYAGFALMVYEDLRPPAPPVAEAALTRIGVGGLAGGFAVLALFVLCGGTLARHLTRRHHRTALDRMQR